MKYRREKKIISLLGILMMLLSIILPCFENDLNFAATVLSTNTSTTTRQRPKGSKVDGAEFFEYLEEYDKYSIIITEGGGGSGEGGGSGDEASANAGNSGSYNDAGGVLGNAAGSGLGTGSTQNQSGTGAGTGKGNGTTGSTLADALRNLKAEIDESRAQSLARVLETAYNASSVAASIAESESIRASIQKRLQQESIKSRFSQTETQVQFETPVYIEQTEIMRTYEVLEETLAPTSRAETRELETRRETVPPETTYEFEPGDFIEKTTERNRLTLSTNVIKETLAPTSVIVEAEPLVTVAQETLIVYDSPIIEVETEEKTEEQTEEQIEESKIEETEKATMPVKDSEDGSGSMGGKEDNVEQDLKGDEGQDEYKGEADDKGMLKKETAGEYAGKKVFELKHNGDIGINPEHLAMTNIRGMIAGVSFLLFAMGAFIFAFGNIDKTNKKNYF